MSASNLSWNLSLGAPAMVRRAVSWWTTEAHRLDGVVPGFVLDVLGGRHMLGGVSATMSDLVVNANTTTAATRLDASGALVACASGELRTDHASGAPELLLEGSLTNKVACRKHNPVDTSNLTPSGDAAAILSVVDDTAALAAAGLLGLCSNGKVYRLDNSAGTSSALASCSGSTGNTNTHSFGAFVRSVNGGTVGVFCGVSDQSSLITKTGPTFALLKNEGVVPEGAGASLCVKASAGAVVHFVLPQLVEATVFGSVIPGETLAAVTRTADLVQLAAAATATLSGTGAALAWRGNVPVAVPGGMLFGKGSSSNSLREGLGSPAQVVLTSDNAGIGGAYLPNLFPGNVGIAFGFGPSGRIVAAGGGVQSDTTVMTYAGSPLYIGQQTGLAAGQILRIRQLVGWSLSDRPSSAAIQIQARTAP